MRTLRIDRSMAELSGKVKAQNCNYLILAK